MEKIVKELSVRELSRDELIELKQRYYVETHKTTTWEDLAEIDTLVSDEKVFEYYEGITFCEEDFFCNDIPKF